MTQIIKEINVEVAKPNLFQAIVAKQHDNNSRFIKATLVDNGINIDIDYTFDVTINATRPDGERRRFIGTVNADGTVTVPLTSWMLELNGTLQCDISVYSSDSRLTSTSFTVFVEEAACESDEIFVAVGSCAVAISSNTICMHLISYNTFSGRSIIPDFVEPDSAVYITSPQTIEKVICGSAVVIVVHGSTTPTVTTTGEANVAKIQNLSTDCYHIVVRAPYTSGASATINISF